MSKLYLRFCEHLTHRSEDLALVSKADHQRLSFRDLGERVEGWMEWLQPLDSGPVAVATGNCSAFIELFVALLALERPMVAMDAAQPLAERVRQATALGCVHLLHRETPASSARPPRSGPDPTVHAASLEPPSAGAPVPPPGTALIKLTSGSTGQPTGVCLGEDALLAGIEQIGRGMELSASDRVLLAIPLSHSYGFDNGVLSLTVLGTPLVLESPTFPHALRRTLVDERITFLPVVPPLVHFLSQSGWPADHRVRTVICAGGRLDPLAAKGFLDRTGLPICQFYGSTETGGISFERQPLAPEAAGTVGHPLPGVRIELRSDGQVEVHSAANHGGILGDTDALCARPVLVGDLAEWTPEGRLRIVGRAADFVNVCGKRFSIAAIEQGLTSLPAIESAAVLATVDPVRGERLVAFVVGDPGGIGPGELPPGLSPRDLRSVDALPYSERGKLDRHRLRQMVGEPR